MSNGGGIIIICNGVGPITGTDHIDIPHYENAILTYAIKPKAGIDHDELQKGLRKLNRLRYKMLEIMEDLTGGTIYEPPHP